MRKGKALYGKTCFLVTGISKELKQIRQNKIIETKKLQTAFKILSGHILSVLGKNHMGE